MSRIFLVLFAAGCTTACGDDAPIGNSAGSAGISGSQADSHGGSAGAAGGGAGGRLGGMGGDSAAGMAGSGVAGAGAGMPASGGSDAAGTAGAAGAAGASMAGGGSGGSPATLPSGVIGLFPSPGGVDICADPALRLSFAGVPKLGSSGKLRVYDVAAPGAPIVTVDFAVSRVTKNVGGQKYNLLRQVYVDGSDVSIPLDSKALAYGKEYYVTVDAGAIVPAAGAFSITDSSAWRFKTWATPPSGSTLSVALDGSGQFCGWQGALDAVPSKNTAPVTISIKNGVYHGVVYFSGKHALTLRGQDRKKTVFSGTNNEDLNPGTRLRALVGADDANGLVLEDLTIHNLTPQGGMQAEALRLQGCDQCVVRRADLLSLQDTLLWSGRIYAEDCYVAGNVDFIWGEGAAYFNRCEIKTVGRSGYNVQARNGAGYGYVFVDSKISSDAGISGNTLARVDVSAYPSSHVAYVNCTLGSHISKAGWTITGGSAPASLRFWEYQSKDPQGSLVDVSGRVAGVQISAAQAAQMRDPRTVLGGWQPPP